MKRKIFCLLIWLVMLSQYVHVSAQLSFKQSLDSVEMIIGGQQRLHIECSDTSLFGFKKNIFDSLSWLEILEESNFKAIPTGYEKSIYFTVFDSGFYRIPELGYINNADTLMPIGNPLYLYVNYPADSITQLRAIKYIEETKTKDRRWIYISIFVLFLGLAFGLLYVFFKADRLNYPVQQLQTLEKIWETSLKALEDLEAKHLWESGQKRTYVDELSFILRNFISRGIKIPALEHSTSETINLINQWHPELNKEERLSHFLRDSDLIKFAQAEPKPDSRQTYFDYVKNFIRDNARLSDEKNEEHRIHFKALLGNGMADQFEFPEDSVPDALLRLPLDGRESKLILYTKLIRQHEFILPGSWVAWHKQGQGSFYKWQSNLLSMSNSVWLQVIIFLFALPVLSIFFPILWIMARLNKENLLGRGVFGLSASSKLLFKNDSRL